MKFFSLIRRLVDVAIVYFYRNWNGERFRSFNNVPIGVLRVLRLVYMLLSFGFTSSAFGFFFRHRGIIGGLSTAIGSFASFGSLYFASPQSMEIRVFFLITSAFFGGASLCPWVVWLLDIDASSMVCALVGISLGFRCYWAATMWARRIDLSYYSGVCLCCPVILLWMITASIEFGGGQPLWTPEMFWQTYISILSFMMYATIYSEVVVQRIQQGDADYVKHAIMFFTGFPALCFHCGVIILMEVLQRLAELLSTFIC